jgi:peptide/nickel transport system substrate-binding protein
VIHALDLTLIGNSADLGLASPKVPDALVPPLLPGVHAKTPGLTASGDVTGARQALAACGKPNGFTTTYVYRDTTSEAKVAQAVQSSLAHVGITVQLRGFPISEFFGRYGGSPEYLKKNGVGLVSRSWAPDWPDVESFLAWLADSRTIVETGNSVNVSVRQPAIDALMDQAKRQLDSRVRAQLWAQVEQKIADEAVLVPLTWERDLLLRGNRATNVHVSPVYMAYDLVTMGVS